MSKGVIFFRFYVVIWIISVNKFDKKVNLRKQLIPFILISLGVDNIDIVAVLSNLISNLLSYQGLYISKRIITAAVSPHTYVVQDEVPVRPSRTSDPCPLQSK